MTPCTCIPDEQTCKSCLEDIRKDGFNEGQADERRMWMLAIVHLKKEQRETVLATLGQLRTIVANANTH